ncbi:hypothetical protein pipiens_007685 [Culex pipiens pipiens]|uniref:Uncharacterized protein n=1 Tax=Culex pipiens pipiens TaxID=38569 RepID=A0ABD1DK91_CULPP
MTETSDKVRAKKRGGGGGLPPSRHQNAIVTSEDGTKYRDIMTDASSTCTDSGILGPVVKTKTEVDINTFCNAAKLLQRGHRLLSANSAYTRPARSTPGKQWVVDFALGKRNVKLVPAGPAGRRRLRQLLRPKAHRPLDEADPPLLPLHGILRRVG